MHPTIEAVLADQGVITSRAHPALSSSLRRLFREGQLANPLPGVFTSGEDASHLTWLRAVCGWSAPLGVIHDSSAGGLWQPALASPVAKLVHPSLRSRRGVANRPLEIGGWILHPDVRFRAAQVIIEVDGRQTHEQPRQFRLDREAQNAYVAAGYRVIRFTWEHLDDADYIVRVVRAVLRLQSYRPDSRTR